MKKTITILSCLLIFLSACKETKKTSVKDEHSAEYALDYEGTYKGTLPCADCPGIATTLTLNKDKSFVYKTVYLDKEAQPKVYKGKYTIKGSIATIKIENQPINFFIGESMAIFMGKEQKPNTGELAKEYELKKMPSTEFTYSGVYKGTYPCADCPGIEATLELHKDKTFAYTTIYKERKDGKFVEKGTYTVKDNILTLKVKKEPIHFLIGTDKLSFMGTQKTPNTGEMAKLYDLKKKVKFEFQGTYKTFSEVKGAYYQTLDIDKKADTYGVRFSASRIKNREACRFSGVGSIKNDTLWVDISNEKKKKVWMYIVPSHDNLGVEVFTKNFDERFQMMLYCGGGSSLAGKYLKQTITPHSIGVFDHKMTIAEALQIISNSQITKRRGKGEFTEDTYDDYEIYTPNNKHLLTLTPKFTGSLDQKINRVKIISPFFTTKKGINVKSTYQEIKKAYKINKIEPTRTHITLIVDEINASFSIPKTSLKKGWWNDATKSVNPDKIPLNTTIEDFILWWNK